MERQLTPKEAKARAAVSRFADALDVFEGTVVLLSNPRRPQGKRYPMSSVVLIALIAMVCGNDDADVIADWWGKTMRSGWGRFWTFRTARRRRM